MQKRNISMDIIRIVSFIFVILIHTNPKPLEGNVFASSILLAILFTCNSNFYMLSGELNLQKRIESLKDYKNYYLNKIISILFPYAVMTFVLSFLNIIEEGVEGVSFETYLKIVYKDFMSNNSSIYLWFLYPLMGLLLTAPFLAKLFTRMTNEELHIMFGAAILWNIVSVYLTSDIGVGFAYSGWLLNGWPISFFAGYYSSRVISQSNRKRWYLAGTIGFLVTILGTWLIPDHYHNAYDLAPAYIFFTMAWYSFLKDIIKIKSNTLRRGIPFLAKHTFMAYMIHQHVINWLERFVNTKNAIYFFPRAAVTFIVSMVIAVIIDICFINPVQKFFRNALTT